MYSSDTLLCSANIILQIIMEKTDPTLIMITQFIITMDLTIGSILFVSIGLARVIKHFNSDLYLDLGVKYKWVPVAVTLTSFVFAVFFQVLAIFGCIESKCFENTKNAVLMTIAIIAFLLHAILWIHLLVRHCQGKTEVLPFYVEATTDLINFSIGSYTILILGLVVIIVGIIFLSLHIPLDTVASSVCQLLNITIVSIFWARTNIRIRDNITEILRNIFYQDNSFTVNV